MIFVQAFVPGTLKDTLPSLVGRILSPFWANCFGGADCWISSGLIAPNRSRSQCSCCGRMRSVLSLVLSYALRCP